MNTLLFLIKTSLEDFRRNKIRTLLTSLGILIGISSVVLLMAMGLGLKRYISRQFESMGSNTIFIMPGQMTQTGPQGSFGGIQFDDKDVRTVKRVRHVLYTVPVYIKFSKISGDSDTKTFQIMATTSDFFSVTSIDAETGRLFNKSDEGKGAKVVVLGSKVAEDLFGSASRALGKSVTVEGSGYKIIGVAKSKGGGGSLNVPSVDERAYMPFKSSLSFNPNKKYFAIYVKADSSDTIGSVKTDIQDVLLKRYSSDDFSVAEQTEVLNSINSIFSILNTVLVAIAAISLIVGGVGIMNIMYVSVVERIREIGIRRAIGATKKDILYLFLTEAILLSTLGGILALLLSAVVVFFMQRLFPAYIDTATVALALGASSFVGIVFGVLPAKKAAQLSPIEAIRYE